LAVVAAGSDAFVPAARSLHIARPNPPRLSAAGSHQRLALKHLTQHGNMLDQEKKSHC
jgi:hypothetical protein